MKNIEVPAVAFAFLSPDALRVFLEIKNYRVSLFTGEDESLNLSDRPSNNIVILPNFAKRSQLAPVAERIGSLICLTNGHHEPIVELDIPILDAVVDGDSIRQSKPRSPHYYTKRIQEAAVALLLSTAEVEKAPPPKQKTPKTIDGWFDAFEQMASADTNFDHDVEYPVCQYIMGELSRQDLQGAMKALVGAGMDNKVIKTFYRWFTSKYADRMSDAMKHYLGDDADNNTTDKWAKKFKVDPIDIELIENIWLELQQADDEDEDV